MASQTVECIELHDFKIIIYNRVSTRRSVGIWTPPTQYQIAISQLLTKKMKYSFHYFKLK